MTATRLDITIEQGADYDGYFQLDYDPTGSAAAMQIRLFSIYPTALLTLTSIDGGLLIDGPNRRVYPVIPPSVSAAINAGKYLYDLKLVSPAGHTTRAYQGTAYVSEGVTETVVQPVIDVTVGLLTQGGYPFVFQDGSALTLSDGTTTSIPALVFQDGSAYTTQNNLTLQLA